MAITDRQEIDKIIASLNARDAKLYHACQLEDFRSYVKLGGVPSRNKLLGSGLKFTEFDTDNIDRQNNVWDKVFGNFSDFGQGFAKPGSESQPNPYGPIQIVFTPDALRHATDLSITLRSAGARDFDRDNECLNGYQDFEKIFQHIDAGQAQGQSQKKNIAFARELDIRFNKNNCTSPEFNCAISNELLPFTDAIYLIVDACIYKGRELIEEVQGLTPKRALKRTYYCPEKESIIKELSTLSADYDCTKTKLLAGNFASRSLEAWVGNRKEFHYDRFIRYLTLGTTRA